jgi:hypothetical protein
MNHLYNPNLTKSKKEYINLNFGLIAGKLI